MFMHWMSATRLSRWQNKTQNKMRPMFIFVNNEDPILFYRKIAGVSRKILKKHGKIYFECHTNYAQQVQQMLVSAGFKNVCIHPDLSGLARFAEASAD